MRLVKANIIVYIIHNNTTYRRNRRGTLYNIARCTVVKTFTRSNCIYIFFNYYYRELVRNQLSTSVLECARGLGGNLPDGLQ